MDLPNWEPSKDEVDNIREELRPLISQLATRDRVTLDAEAWRQRGLSEI